MSIIIVGFATDDNSHLTLVLGYILFGTGLSLAIGLSNITALNAVGADFWTMLPGLFKPLDKLALFWALL